jgi:hypothetical protein
VSESLQQKWSPPNPGALHGADVESMDIDRGQRTSGPILLEVNGRRMDRYAADRTVKRLAKRAGITKRISPHSLRHFSITAALAAGVPLRDVQEAACHADPRTTMRYDRAGQSLDRDATYIVAATYGTCCSRTSITSTSSTRPSTASTTPGPTRGRSWGSCRCTRRTGSSHSRSTHRCIRWWVGGGLSP